MASRELATLNRFILEDLNISFTVSENAPNSFKELKATCPDARKLVIFKGGSETCVYPTIEDNYIFRAIHDYHHITLNANFSMLGEFKTIRAHYLKLKAYKASKNALKLFLIDTRAQVEFYYKTGKFVENQKSFAFAKFK